MVSRACSEPSRIGEPDLSPLAMRVGIVSKESAEQRLLDAMLLVLPSLSKYAYSIPISAACEPHDLLGYSKDRISSHSQVYPYPREIYDPAFLEQEKPFEPSRSGLATY